MDGSRIEIVIDRGESVDLLFLSLFANSSLTLIGCDGGQLCLLFLKHAIAAALMHGSAIIAEHSRLVALVKWAGSRTNASTVACSALSSCVSRDQLFT